MILNIKKLIDYKVDIKNLRFNLIQFLILLISILFPLNQQLHLKPYPSVDGFIIDYLIVKISLPEILLITLTFLRIPELIHSVKRSYIGKFMLGVFLISSLISTIFSNYKFLSVYENLILFLLLINAFTLSKDLNFNYLKIFLQSIKFWIILLSLLGLFQFYFQSSIFNNYALFGEFPYSDDYYHIKQKGFLFQYLIPPYAIFSHSNIFGGFLLVSIMVLGLFKKDFLYLHLICFSMFLIIGSFNIFICYLLWVFLTKVFNKDLSKSFYFGVLLFLWLVIFMFSYNYQAFIDNSSIYRRLYMVDLSRVLFEKHPEYFLFGSGYFNYFEIVKNNLYDYELVRFFQPPHNLIILLIWQYGLLLPLTLLALLWRYFKKISRNQIYFLLIILIGGTFDHFFLTNHQIKFYLLWVVPYSLMFENSIK